jgi:hypothetical protein
MNYIKSNQQRSKIAITLVLIVMTLDILGLISSVLEYLLIKKAEEGTISVEEANANDLRQQIISIVYLIVYIISAITFIQWFRRAYANLIMVFGRLNHDEGWAAGAWFVPIIALYRPYQIMKELYEKTSALLNDKLGSYVTNFTFIGIWWTLWIITNVTGQISFRYTLQAESFSELTISSIISIVTELIGIPLALITIKVIRDYAKMENLLAQLNFDEEDETPPTDLAIETID